MGNINFFREINLGRLTIRLFTLRRGSLFHDPVFRRVGSWTCLRIVNFRISAHIR